MTDLEKAPEPGLGLRAPAAPLRREDVGVEEQQRRRRELPLVDVGGFQARLDAFLTEEQPLVVMRGGAGFSDGGNFIAGRGGDPKTGSPIPAVVGDS